MTKFQALVLAAALVVPGAQAQTENSARLFTQVDPILKDLSEITGWKVRRKVPSDYITKSRIGEFLERRIREAVKPEDIRVESLALRMFGFIPDDYDLKKAVVDLMTEQAAAFYDYDRKKLFITESDTSFLEKRAALVHELAHALADQNYSIGKYLRKGAKSDDAATAREAVTEGQATWLMWAYVSKAGGGEAKVSEFILDSMKGAASEAVGSQYPVFEKAPLYLRESLMFPYTAGLRFQNAVFEKMGQKGFDEVFRRPPVSTQQILHPEQYLAGRQPTVPKLPDIANPKDYKTLADGELGELDFHVLLEQFAGRELADGLAPHWVGGRFRLSESKKERAPLLTFAAEWDSPARAREFYDAYREILGKKWRNADFRERSPERLSGVGDRGGFVVRLEGARVSSVEGLRESKVN